MKNYQQLGRTLNKNEQKNTFGGDDLEPAVSMICICTGNLNYNVSTTCVGSSATCTSNASATCGGAFVCYNSDIEEPIDQ
ncbi:hypothetical protein [Chryseosolibacter indicus]|uniref:Natural product n=1 Tax=Chryseosolibacter indicus TaxID=2782351 RepID=A0ABS5VX45_9BACT|nr:hypothetical protein [Chryseosolibacter indicus]MBT1705425.1 hypothetical protein [Chryseosolibacter indicus]